jgi:glucose/arabinose dehydrogenase
MKFKLLKRMVLRSGAGLLAAALVLSACSPTVNMGESQATRAATQSEISTQIPTQVQDGAPSATDTSLPAVTSTAEPTSIPLTGSTPEATGTPTAAEQSTETPTAIENASTFPDPSGFEWAPVVSGIGRPADLQPSPDGTGRLFVLSQRGLVLIAQDGALAAEPFLDIRDRVGANGNEQGLLGLAFHPDFANNGTFFLNYTDLQGDTVISRFMVSPANGSQADPGSEQVLLQVDQPYANHNGGGMVFGPDGYLYISLGDGGSAGDPQGHGQNTNTLLGTILRIDIDQSGPDGSPYAIPDDNPFASGGGEPEIWAYGLRNPWRFSFDRTNGDLFIADVGQNAWEEVSYQPGGSAGGLNYGWNFREGANPFRGTPPAGAELVDPIYEYGHDQGCSITGGYVYRGSALPEFQGIYLFGDYCSGYIWGLLRDSGGNWQAQRLFETGFNLSAFGLDEAGEIYSIQQEDGSIYRLQRRP